MRWKERATLMQADYRDTLSACDGVADLVLTSPPYCDARTYGHAVSWTDEDYQRLGDAVFAALKPGGHALINVDAPVREWRKGMGTERGFHPWRLMLDWAERVGFRVPDRLAYQRNGQPGYYPARFRNDWEPLLWFQRPGSDGWFGHIVEKGAGRLGRQTSYRLASGEMAPHKRNNERASRREKYRGNLWAYGNVGVNCTGCPELEAAQHSARWPYRLARDIVRCFCPPDGLACDPFLGAGTSLIAALDEGRRFRGGDLFERQDDGKPWIDVAGEIAEERYRQQALFGGLR